MLATKNTLHLFCMLAVTTALSGCSIMPRSAADAGNVNEVSRDQEQSAYAADSSQRRVQRHFYAAIGLGKSSLQPDASEVDGLDVNQTSSTGRQLALGLDVNRHFSVELDTADLGSAGFSPGGRINYQVHSASALMYAGKQRHRYRRQGFTGYGRLGFGLLNNSAEGGINFEQENSSHFLLGAGLEYMTKIGLGLRAEAISFDSDVRYGQLALMYRFGKNQSKKPVEIPQAPTPAPQPAPVPAVQVAKPAQKPAPVIQPVPQPVTTGRGVCAEFDGVLEGVNFHSGSDQLTDTGKSVLARAAQKLLQCTDVSISITAHTDSQGAEDYNQKLSAKRARSVMINLFNRGIEKHRMKGRAFGESRPIDTNATEEGRRRNRRVEVVAQ